MNNPLIATDSFAYVPGDNPQRNIIQRLDAISNAFYASMVSTTITIPVAAATTNNQLANFIPAGALVTSLGIFFTENVDAGVAGVLSVAFGNASADVSIVGSTALNAAGTDIVINSFTSTSSKHALTSGGNAIPFAADSALWFGNQSDLWFQTIVSGNVLGATVDVKVVMEYVATTNL